MNADLAGAAVDARLSHISPLWRLRRTYDSCDASSTGFRRATSAPVARSLADQERIGRAGGTIEILPTPVDLSLGGEPRGELAEQLLDVLAA